MPGQIAVDEGSNEITAVPKLLELLGISGAVVTLDAIHCQTKTAQKIRGKQADYILTVKSNQPTLQKILGELFEAYGEDGYHDKKARICKTSEKNRGRDEFLMYTVAPAPKELGQRGWAGDQPVRGRLSIASSFTTPPGTAVG